MALLRTQFLYLSSNMQSSISSSYGSPALNHSAFVVCGAKDGKLVDIRKFQGVRIINKHCKILRKQ